MRINESERWSHLMGDLAAECRHRGRDPIDLSGDESRSTVSFVVDPKSRLTRTVQVPQFVVDGDNHRQFAVEFFALTLDPNGRV